MNFLAHLYLSGDDPARKVGNFMGDFVKGRALSARFEPGIVAGIGLHRAIDHFTDTHALVKQSKKRLQPTYRHYSGVIVDVFYDHFLARHWPTYSPEPLADFAQRAYQDILDRSPILPDEVKQLLPYMMKGNWLLNYQHVEGIDRALTGMSRRTTFVSHMQHASADLQEHYTAFEAEFSHFFPELRAFCEEWIGKEESR
ncbi:MAG: ACP phosphodiesterase [Cyclobacteriaceae bacterium]|jgi:acyl carrier protein phosphodiesterase|nr:ACP phosphodiesterase [Cyclobacteriaceae bacterium]